jgi:hypothetical protein
MSNCLVSERRTCEAVKSNSSAELEARNDGGRSASEGMLSGRREGSVGVIFAYIEEVECLLKVKSLVDSVGYQYSPPWPS